MDQDQVPKRLCPKCGEVLGTNLPCTECRLDRKMRWLVYTDRRKRPVDIRELYYKLKTSSQHKRVPFAIPRSGDFVDWWLRTEDVCVYCGISLEAYIRLVDFAGGYKGSNQLLMTLKRSLPTHQTSIWCFDVGLLDSARPYSLDNICKSCRFCSQIKGGFLTAQEMGIIGPAFLQRALIALKGEEHP